MGVDIRKGKKDYYTRYKVYSPNTDITNYIEIENSFIDILHAKDITAYDTATNVYGNKFQRDETRATIETLDKTDIGTDYFLYAIAEECWYRVESVSANSHNETQRWSSRPVNTTTMVIIKCN